MYVYCLAIKKVKKSSIDSEFDFKVEVALMHMLDHPNIMKVYDVFMSDDSYYCVMRNCTGGELFDEFVSNGKFDEFRAAEVLHQVLSAVAYCHARGVCHRDIKLENILIDSKEEFAPIKLIDFGCATVFNPLHRHQQQQKQECHTFSGQESSITNDNSITKSSLCPPVVTVTNNSLHKFGGLNIPSLVPQQIGIKSKSEHIFSFHQKHRTGYVPPSTFSNDTLDTNIKVDSTQQNEEEYLDTYINDDQISKLENKHSIDDLNIGINGIFTPVNHMEQSNCLSTSSIDKNLFQFPQQKIKVSENKNNSTSNVNVFPSPDDLNNNKEIFPTFISESTDDFMISRGTPLIGQSGRVSSVAIDASPLFRPSSPAQMNGLSPFIAPANHRPIIQSDYGPLTGVVGTTAYLAPEVLQQAFYNEKVDTWACGVLLFFLISGVLPYEHENPAVVEHWLRCGRSWSFEPISVWKQVSSSCKNLICSLLDPNPATRLSARRALEHPWFAERLEGRPQDPSMRVLVAEYQGRRGTEEKLENNLKESDIVLMKGALSNAMATNIDYLNGDQTQNNSNRNANRKTVIKASRMMMKPVQNDFHSLTHIKNSIKNNGSEPLVLNKNIKNNDETECIVNDFFNDLSTPVMLFPVSPLKETELRNKKNHLPFSPIDENPDETNFNTTNNKKYDHNKKPISPLIPNSQLPSPSRFSSSPPLVRFDAQPSLKYVREISPRTVEHMRPSSSAMGVDALLPSWKDPWEALRKIANVFKSKSRSVKKTENGCSIGLQDIPNPNQGNTDGVYHAPSSDLYRNNKQQQNGVNTAPRRSFGSGQLSTVKEAIRNLALMGGNYRVFINSQPSIVDAHLIFLSVLVHHCLGESERQSIHAAFSSLAERGAWAISVRALRAAQQRLVPNVDQEDFEFALQVLAKSYAQANAELILQDLDYKREGHLIQNNNKINNKKNINNHNHLKNKCNNTNCENFPNFSNVLVIGDTPQQQKACLHNGFDNINNNNKNMHENLANFANSEYDHHNLVNNNDDLPVSEKTHLSVSALSCIGKSSRNGKFYSVCSNHKSTNMNVNIDDDSCSHMQSVPTLPNLMSSNSHVRIFSLTGSSGLLNGGWSRKFAGDAYSMTEGKNLNSEKLFKSEFSLEADGVGEDNFEDNFEDDGYIGLAEFALAAARREDLLTDAKLNVLGRILDFDKDGYLSAKDLFNALKLTGLHAMEEEEAKLLTERIVQQVDFDGDGKLSLQDIALCLLPVCSEDFCDLIELAETASLFQEGHAGGQDFSDDADPTFMAHQGSTLFVTSSGAGDCGSSSRRAALGILAPTAAAVTSSREVVRRGSNAFQCCRNLCGSQQKKNYTSANTSNRDTILSSRRIVSHSIRSLRKQQFASNLGPDEVAGLVKDAEQNIEYPLNIPHHAATSKKSAANCKSSPSTAQNFTHMIMDANTVFDETGIDLTTVKEEDEIKNQRRSNLIPEVENWVLGPEKPQNRVSASSTLFNVTGSNLNGHPHRHQIESSFQQTPNDKPRRSFSYTPIEEGHNTNNHQSRSFCNTTHSNSKNNISQNLVNDVESPNLAGRQSRCLPWRQSSKKACSSNKINNTMMQQQSSTFQSTPNALEGCEIFSSQPIPTTTLSTSNSRNLIKKSVYALPSALSPRTVYSLVSLNDDDGDGHTIPPDTFPSQTDSQGNNNHNKLEDLSPSRNVSNVNNKNNTTGDPYLSPPLASIVRDVSTGGHSILRTALSSLQLHVSSAAAPVNPSETPIDTLLCAVNDSSLHPPDLERGRTAVSVRSGAALPMISAAEMSPPVNSPQDNNNPQMSRTFVLNGHQQLSARIRDFNSISTPPHSMSRANFASKKPIHVSINSIKSTPNPDFIKNSHDADKNNTDNYDNYDSPIHNCHNNQNPISNNISSPNQMKDLYCSVSLASPSPIGPVGDISSTSAHFINQISNVGNSCTPFENIPTGYKFLRRLSLCGNFDVEGCAIQPGDREHSQYYITMTSLSPTQSPPPFNVPSGLNITSPPPSAGRAVRDMSETTVGDGNPQKKTENWAHQQNGGRRRASLWSDLPHHQSQTTLNVNNSVVGTGNQDSSLREVSK